MLLERIVTLANVKTETHFRVMERSLRSLGSKLPISVIPFDDTRFSLPEGSSWWYKPAITSWLESYGARPMMMKYQCLTEAGYQFVDTDVIFLRDPEKVLLPHSGFIVSCGHWRDTAHTVTDESYSILSAKSTNWPLRTFNSGQFACDRAFYTPDSLKATASDPRYQKTILDCPFHDQPGLNLLIDLVDAPLVNLTLPPYFMESTWAGDYSGDWESYWRDDERKPLLLHWAGLEIDGKRPIDSLYLQFLLPAEKEKFLATRRKQPVGLRRFLRWR